MLVFQPDLDIALPDLAEKSEVVICLDCSNSMESVPFLQAKQIALYALSLVGKKQKINIVKFGTGECSSLMCPSSSIVTHSGVELMALGTRDLICGAGGSIAWSSRTRNLEPDPQVQIPTRPLTSSRCCFAQVTSIFHASVSSSIR